MELPDIPDDIFREAKRITAMDWYEGDVSGEIARALLSERLSERERWKPAVTYFERYCQDEAEDVEDCVCGEQQHADAKAFAAAIRSQP